MISIGTSDGENSFIGIEHLTEKEVGEFRTSAKSPLLSGPMAAPNGSNAEFAQLAELALGWRLCGIPVFPFRVELSSSELAVNHLERHASGPLPGRILRFSTVVS